MWIVNSNVCFSGCKHMAIWNQLNINYLSGDLAKIIDFTWQFDLVAQMIRMQVLIVFFKLFYKICICVCWATSILGVIIHFTDVSAGWLLSSNNLDLVSKSVLSENLWRRLFPLLSHEVHDLMIFCHANFSVFYTCHGRCNNRHQSSDNLHSTGVNNAFFSVLELNTGLFFFFLKKKSDT